MHTSVYLALWRFTCTGDFDGLLLDLDVDGNGNVD